MKELPKWLVNFNNLKLTEKYLNKWETLYPVNTYVLSEPNNGSYKNNYKGLDNSVFPYDLKKLVKDNGLGLIRSTPFGNSLTKDLAIQLIDSENLGNNATKATDFLAVSFSSTDYIGHQFATNSIEIEDTYLRLDKDIAELLNYLDKKVGKNEYLVFLTADHGGAHNPKYFQDKKGNAGYFQTGEVKNKLNDYLQGIYNSKNLVRSLTNYQVHLNYSEIELLKIDQKDLESSIIYFLKKQDGIAFVASMNNLDTVALPNTIKEKMINGYNYKRSGVITYILEPQWYGGKPNSGGTTHGTWAPYDSHIPFVLMGWKIKPGKNYNQVYMTDIAPTIAALLKIEEPNGNIGKPVIEVFN